MSEHEMDAALIARCPETLSLGALVLGSLDPQERERLEVHVHSCSVCSATLSELAPVPGLLNRVDRADLELGPPPPELLERVLAAARTEEAKPSLAPDRTRTRRRWAALAIGGSVAAGLIVVTALVWTNPFGSAPPPSGPVAVSADPGATVSASVTMSPTDTGTELALALTGVASGQHCELVAVGRDGSREVAATWVATYDGEAHVTGTTGLALDQIAALEVTTPDGTTLATLTVPPHA